MDIQQSHSADDENILGPQNFFRLFCVAFNPGRLCNSLLLARIKILKQWFFKKIFLLLVKNINRIGVLDLTVAD